MTNDNYRQVYKIFLQKIGDFSVVGDFLSISLFSNIPRCSFEDIFLNG